MPFIDPQIFEKRFASTPKSITGEIVEFCQQIASTALPTYVPIYPDPEAELNECFFNVSRHVAEEGGSIVFGWAIWEWPKVYFEAEHHAVWVKDGQMTDVTPSKLGIKRILFLPDPEKAFDFERFRRLENIIVSIGRFRNVPAFIKAAHELHELMESNSNGREVNLSRSIFVRKIEEVRLALAYILIEMAVYKKPGDECICRSGLSYRECCSKLIDVSDLPAYDSQPAPRETPRDRW